MKLIGIAGKKRSGKDTAARALMVECGYYRFSFASILKQMLLTLLERLGIDPETADRMIDGDLKEMPVPQLMGKSARHAMQTLGHEWGRALIGENLWVAATLRAASACDKVVISDVRYANEAQTIREAGGRVVEIQRPMNWIKDDHPTEQIDFSVDHIILNKGTRKDLQKAIIDYERRN